MSSLSVQEVAREKHSEGVSRVSIALGALPLAAALKAQVVEPVAGGKDGELTLAGGFPLVLLVISLWDRRASSEERADCPASYRTVFIPASEPIL